MMNFSQHFNKRQKDENSTAEGSENANKLPPVHQRLLSEIGGCSDKISLLRTVFSHWIQEKNLNSANRHNCQRGLETLIHNIQKCENQARKSISMQELVKIENVDKKEEKIDLEPSIEEVVSEACQVVKVSRRSKRIIKKKEVFETAEEPSKAEDHVCPKCHQKFKNGQGLGGHMSRVHQGQSVSYQRKIMVREGRTFDRMMFRCAKHFHDQG